MIDIPDAIFTLQDVSHSIKATSILQNISFNLAKGSINIVIGPSGGGKSTLLRLMNRLENPSKGELSLQGQSIDHFKPTELRKKIVLNLQETSFFPGSLQQNLELPLRLHLNKIDTTTTSEIRKLLDICCLSSNLLDRDPDTFSVGQRQRASIARALVLKPQILLLDEPTAPLDISVAEKLRTNLFKYCKENEITVVIASHDLNLTKDADTIIFLVDGVIIEQGSPDELLNRSKSPILQAFLERRLE